MGKGDWDLKQRFTLRAGTMLLLFSILLVTLALSDFLYLGLTKVFPGADEIMWRFRVNLDKYLLIAAFISFGFFLFTLYKKRPQGQFILEIIMCLTIYLLY